MADAELKHSDYPMTLRQVADYVSCSVHTITMASRRGDLKFYDRGGKGYRRYYKSDVDAWLKGQPSAKES